MKNYIFKKIFVVTFLFCYTSMFGVLTKSGNIVTDSVSGLQWQDTTANTSPTMTWSAAINYCDNLILDTFYDWRLPNIYELQSILNYQTVVSGSFVSTVFTNRGTGNPYYWSSTTRRNDTTQAWLVNEAITTSPKTGSYFVRCVRSGTNPE